MSMDYNKIRQLVKLVEKNRLSELSIEEEGLSVTIKVETPTNTVQVISSQTQEFVEAQSFTQYENIPFEEAAPVEIPSEHHYEIKSPMVGVFYRCPSPDSPAFVEVGEHVEVGQTIGLIEAMKVFSEVPAEVAGRIMFLAVDNSQLVQQGEVLAIIDTSDVSENTFE